MMRPSSRLAPLQMRGPRAWMTIAPGLPYVAAVAVVFFWKISCHASRRTDRAAVERSRRCHAEEIDIG
jgi:hypothetical protein